MNYDTERFRGLNPYLVKKGEKILEDPEKFNNWLNEPNSELEGSKPINIAIDPEGTSRVISLLERMEEKDKRIRYIIASIILCTTLFAAWYTVYIVGLPATNVLAMALLALGIFFSILALDQIEKLILPTEKGSEGISKMEAQTRERIIKSLSLGILFCLAWWLLTDNLLKSLGTSLLVTIFFFSSFKDDEKES